ncbi:hypothetical protein [Parendozoicomonas haliclonae]|uniref:Uncharacterized protein n=1 Tax=Parendozoicomonas haliclonae TaxID=1960125 RepID=A0A1X7ALV0_9GAMM|nr:hypothetical protein [Parendozoicomonas haliclonae]SMA48533.1 hypothetical protein EHSB41UT_02782 [Parendozoicomonas haliclonae]
MSLSSPEFLPFWRKLSRTIFTRTAITRTATCLVMTGMTSIAAAMTGEFEKRVFDVTWAGVDESSQLILTMLPSSGVYTYQKEGETEEVARFREELVNGLFKADDESKVKDESGIEEKDEPEFSWTELIAYALALHERKTDDGEEHNKPFLAQADDPVLGSIAEARFEFRGSIVNQVKIGDDEDKPLKKMIFFGKDKNEVSLEIEVVILDDSVHGISILENTDLPGGGKKSLALSSMDLQLVAEMDKGNESDGEEALTDHVSTSESASSPEPDSPEAVPLQKDQDQDQVYVSRPSTGSSFNSELPIPPAKRVKLNNGAVESANTSGVSSPASSPAGSPIQSLNSPK